MVNQREMLTVTCIRIRYSAAWSESYPNRRNTFPQRNRKERDIIYNNGMFIVALV
jgi:hypothetical protein